MNFWNNANPMEPLEVVRLKEGKEIQEFEVDYAAWDAIANKSHERFLDFFDTCWRLKLQQEAFQRASIFPYYSQPDFCDCL